MSNRGPTASPSFFDGDDDYQPPPAVSLADKFGVPPMSVLDRRAGYWQQRKRDWLTLGMSSELGRGESLLMAPSMDVVDRSVGHWQQDSVSGIHAAYSNGTSIFDPVICELVYRWFTRPGGRVLDPFAGGSVRGVVASTLARWYVGVDLRAEQVEANGAQADLGSDIRPSWLVGDSTDLGAVLAPVDEFDLIFSPPYADLERYSDDPRDLSVMPYGDFVEAHAAVIAAATARLRPDRFAAWVISDVRDGRGSYRGLVAETIRAFRAAGLDLHNDAVILDQIGTSALRAERPFLTTRKLTRCHQHLLVFVKGDARRATEACADTKDPTA